MQNKITKLFLLLSLVVPAHTMFAADNDYQEAYSHDATTRKKEKKICKLSVNCLSVNGNLFVNGVEFSNLSTLAGALISTSLITPTGYGYVYNTAAAQTVGNGLPVLFGTPGPLFGMTYAPATGVMTVTNAGTYAINFSVSSAASDQFTIFVNGTAQPSTVYSSGTVLGARDTGIAIVTLPAGALVTLVNTSGVGVLLAAGSVGTATGTGINASMLIQRVA